MDRRKLPFLEHLALSLSSMLMTPIPLSQLPLTFTSLLSPPPPPLSTLTPPQSPLSPHQPPAASCLVLIQAPPLVLHTLLLGLGCAPSWKAQSLGHGHLLAGGRERDGVREKLWGSALAEVKPPTRRLLRTTRRDYSNSQAYSSGMAMEGKEGPGQVRSWGSCRVRRGRRECPEPTGDERHEESSSTPLVPSDRCTA